MRVIIVDHHVVFREGLKSVLAAFDDLKVVGEASTAKEGFALAGDQLPDLIVMDLVLPGLDGCELARELRRRRPDVQLLVLTACDAAQDLLDALDAGVQGYALKSEPVEAIVNAMRMVGSGRRYVAQKLSHISERVRRSGLARTVLALLSAREREVFRLSTAGLPAAEIAQGAVHLAQDGRNAPIPHSEEVRSSQHHRTGAFRRLARPDSSGPTKPGDRQRRQRGRSMHASMTAAHVTGMVDEARGVHGWPLEVELAVIPSEEHAIAPTPLPEVPFGLAMIDPVSGLIVGTNREAERLLGLSPGALVSFQNLVAGDGGRSAAGAGRDRDRRDRPVRLSTADGGQRRDA